MARTCRCKPMTCASVQCTFAPGFLVQRRCACAGPAGSARWLLRWRVQRNAAALQAVRHARGAGRVYALRERRRTAATLARSFRHPSCGCDTGDNTVQAAPQLRTRLRAA
jgi:hypothetical protein